jgi:hypothetical protein
MPLLALLLTLVCPTAPPRALPFLVCWDYTFLTFRSLAGTGCCRPGERRFGADATLAAVNGRQFLIPFGDGKG